MPAHEQKDNIFECNLTPWSGGLDMRPAHIEITCCIGPPPCPFTRRYAHVLPARLTVTVAGGQVFSYKAGDFIVSARGMWHFSTPLGTELAILPVIDQLGAGEIGAELMHGGH